MDKPISQIHPISSTADRVQDKKEEPGSLEQARRFSFGKFDFYPASQWLTYKNKPCHLDDKMLQLLAILIEHKPNLVTKDELMRQLWPDTQVSDWSLARLVSDTRKILEDDGKSQSIIKTIRGKGFAFVAPLDEIIDATSQLKNAATPVLSDQASARSKTTRGRTVLMASTAFVLLLFSGLYLYHRFSTTGEDVAWPSQQPVINHNMKQHHVRVMQSIKKNLHLTKTSFKAQVRRRNELGDLLLARMPELESLSWEQRLRKAHSTLNADEKFLFDQIRAMTEGPIRRGNKAILDSLEAHPELYEFVSSLTPLHAHLQIWLSKYDKVFLSRDDMALLYVGVEDGVPFPSAVDQEVTDWLAENDQPSHATTAQD